MRYIYLLCLGSLFILAGCTSAPDKPQSKAIIRDEKQAVKFVNKYFSETFPKTFPKYEYHKVEYRPIEEDWAVSYLGPFMGTLVVFFVSKDGTVQHVGFNFPPDWK